MNALLQTASFSPLSEQEQAEVWPQIESSLIGMKSWPIMPPDFDVTNILALTSRPPEYAAETRLAAILLKLYGDMYRVQCHRITG